MGPLSLQPGCPFCPWHGVGRHSLFSPHLLQGRRLAVVLLRVSPGTAGAGRCRGLSPASLVLFRGGPSGPRASLFSEVFPRSFSGSGGGGEKSGTETLISHLSHTLPGWGVPPRSPGARTSRDLRASARLCLLFTGHVPRFWQGQSHSVRAEPSASCAGVCWWVQGPRPCATRPPACSRAQSARSSALPGALRAAVSAGSAVLLEPCRRAALGGWSPGGRPAVPPPSGSRHQPACRPPPVPLLGRRWSGRWT